MVRYTWIPVSEGGAIFATGLGLLPMYAVNQTSTGRHTPSQSMHGMALEPVLWRPINTTMVKGRSDQCGRRFHPPGHVASCGPRMVGLWRRPATPRPLTWPRWPGRRLRIVSQKDEGA